MSLLVALLLSGPPAGATNVFGRCVRALVEAVVKDDPYEFEQVDTDWLERQVAAYSIKRAWGKLSDQDEERLRVMQRELAGRANPTPPSGLPQ